ncbi:scavenger receptor cysteine-rich type 1 protein M130-like isoform X2 [Tyto alba]|uniref:scavenger receptor cysteine-rich type 1 protein M130-like isoform X2 n=1 Tax=Tyto alba TaxID=56313 RepID=UPI001C679C04|nr:scavenger receptor cysteine-rich type 1 protein M130-like isoform X2 [Tyto alba]
MEQVIGGRGPVSREITRLITAQKVLLPPLAPGYGAAYISPSPAPRRGVWDGRMVPVTVLGLLLCVQLCGGTGELRLVDGGGRCAGRVEVKHDGEWGSVCVYDFDRDAEWATVVCRQLGCGSVAKASPYALFGQGTGRIWLHPFFCRGDELMLQDCPHFGWGQHFCGHKWDVGVICTGAVELRLAAGGHPCAGRVEVKLQGHWGSVVDDNWDMEDAEVVCQQLGCGSATHIYGTSAIALFGKGDGASSLAVVNCRGDEATLWDCEIHGWGPYLGIHEFDTAVVCQGFARLVGGDSACAGRLEVRRGRAWTSVCEDDVDIKAAEVVCRELGCGTVLPVPVSSRFGGDTGPLWEAGFKCTGTETLLATCARQPSPRQGCTGHASVICSPYTGFRLADNNSDCAGRVEVEMRGTWGSLCATGWDLLDAHVLCHHLGCGPAVTVPPGGSFGIAKPLRLVEGESRCDGRLEVAASPGTWARVPAGLGNTWGASTVCQELGCGVPEKVYTVPSSGSVGLRFADAKENLTQYNILVTTATPTGSPEEVAVVCSGSRQVRLAGSPRRCTGRVEVYINGTWGTVCQETWDILDATVVCRQLGCGMALAAPGPAHFGPGMGPLWLDAGSCAGTEESLWDCPASARHSCQRGGGAAVCSEQQSLRLVGSSARCSGHLEVFYNGTWGRVCANGTSPATAAAVCQELGCGNRGKLATAPAQDLVPAWLAWVGCEEGTRSFWRCPSAPWHLQSCSPGGDAHVACDEDGDSTSGTPTPSPGSRCPDGATCTDVPSKSTPVAPVRTVSVPMVLCVVLGTLLCLALGALAVQACRARAQCQGHDRAADAVSDGVYEELDYTMIVEYQEELTHSGSLSERLRMKLPYYTGDSMEESDPKAAPAQHGPPDGYDDAVAVLEEFHAPNTGDISEGVAQRSSGCVLPTGGRCPPPSPPGASKDPLAQPLEDTDYDDAAVGTLRTSL